MRWLFYSVGCLCLTVVVAILLVLLTIVSPFILIWSCIPKTYKRRGAPENEQFTDQELETIEDLNTVEGWKIY